MTPPAAATVAGRRAPRDADSEYIVTRTPRRSSTAVREPQARPQTREWPRPATRPSSRASAAAAALEATLAPAPARREHPAPSRTRREGPAPARPRREAPSRSRAQAPRSARTRTDHVARQALRLQPPRLDRIVRGRAWIPVLGAMLVAIVGLRVAVLKLGASVGTQIQQATLLESSNSILRTRISALADNRRIEKLAQAYGMHLPNPLDVHFVPSSAGRHVQAAINNISAPANSTFLSGLATEQHNDAQSTQYTSSLSAGGGASAVTSGSSSTTSTAGSAGAGVSSSTTGSLTAGQTTAGATVSSSGTPASGAGATASTAVAGTTAGATSTNSSAGSSSTAGGTAALNTGPTDTAGGTTQSQTGSTTGGSGGSGLAG